MTDPESQIEKVLYLWHRSNDLQSKSDALRWSAAEIAYDLFYKGYAKVLAEAMGVNEDTIYLLKDAWSLYLFLKEDDADEAKRAKEKRTYVWFGRLETLRKKYGMSAPECFDLLNSKESVDAMKESVGLHRDEEPWLRILQRKGFRSNLDNLVAYGPPWLRKAARDFIRTIRENE